MDTKCRKLKRGIHTACLKDRKAFSTSALARSGVLLAEGLLRLLSHDPAPKFSSLLYVPLLILVGARS